MDFLALEFDRIERGVLDLEFGRGVRGFEGPLRDAIIDEAREIVSLGGVGGRPVKGVRIVLLGEEASSRRFLNMLGQMRYRLASCSTCPKTAKARVYPWLQMQ
jgi:hypothetical protein